MTNNITLKNKIKIATDYIEKDGGNSATGLDNSLKKINEDLDKITNEDYKNNRNELDDLGKKLKCCNKGKASRKYKTNKDKFFSLLNKKNNEIDAVAITDNKKRSKKDINSKENSDNIESNTYLNLPDDLNKINKELLNLKNTVENNNSSIEKNISLKLKGDLNKINKELSSFKKILEISNLHEDISNLSSSINNNLENKIKRLKEDISLEVKNEFKSTSILSNIGENVEVLPPQINKISEKIDGLSIKFDEFDNGQNLKYLSDIPKDEKAIIELSKFMKDGLEQFENIAKYHIQKQVDFDRLDADKNRINDQISKAENNAKEKAKIELAKKIFNSFPSEFEKINSVFDDVISRKYNKDDKIDTTNKDIQKLEIYIEGIKKDKSTYKIMTPDISIADEVVKRATVEVITVKKSKTAKK